MAIAFLCSLTGLYILVGWVVTYTTSTTMSSSAASETLETQPKTPESEKALEDQTPQASDQSNVEGGEEVEGEEEEEECGFCLFMKGGGCKESFTAWEKCIEEAEKNKEDIVDKCFEITSALKKCMEAHSDYYKPILQAEKAAEQEVVKELEREVAEKGGESDA